MFRGKCPFRMFITSKTTKVWNKIMGCCWCKEFLCLQHASIHGQGWWSKGEEAGPSSCKDMVCHMCGTRRGVTTNTFFTSCELTNFLLSKKMTVFETLRKNTSEIPALFLSGKQRTVHYSIWFYLWSNIGIIYTSNKQDCHPLFITASWNMNGRGKRKQSWNHHAL